MADTIRILTTGKGGDAGSWEVRGRQLGAAVGNVKPMATVADMKGHDVVVAVKRIPADLVRRLQSSRTPWVWDLVDLYPQPECSKWDRNSAITRIRNKIRAAGPDGVIYPNRTMAEDVGIPGVVVEHHYRPTLTPAPLQDEVKVVGYEGDPRYLGRWRDHLVAACDSRGWEFREGGRIEDYDIVVAFRDGEHAGYCQRNWKSNVKLANAHGAGVPFIGQPDPGYVETSTGAECWVENFAELDSALGGLAPLEVRRPVRDKFLGGRIDLAGCANKVTEYARLLVS